MLYPSLGFRPASDKYRDSFDTIFRRQPARKGSFMLTYTGRAFFPYDLREEDFCIEDIAHALAMLCRYGGHCRKFYSIAEHSVLISRMVSKEHALCGLMHDATEAYLVDMPRPIKVGFPQYKEMEAKLWAVISRRFGLPLELPQEVHDVDHQALFHEHAALMPPVPEGLEWGMGLTKPDLLRADLIKGWCWQDAERFFLNRYKELTA